MGNDDRVLSQAEIDALLSSSSVSVPAPSPAAPKPAAPAVKAAVAPPPPPPAPQAAVPPTPAPQAAAPPPPKVNAAPPPQPAAQAAPPPVQTPAAAAAPKPVAQQSGPTPEQVTNLCKQIVSEQTRDMAKQLVELTIKVKKLDEVKQRVEQIEDKLDEIAEMVQSSPRAVKAMGAKINEIYGLLENMQQTTHHESDEERIRDQFHCVNCHSEKLVAVHVKCTSCGTQNWMGWFPGESAENPEEHY